MQIIITVIGILFCSMDRQRNCIPTRFLGCKDLTNYKRRSFSSLAKANKSKRIDGNSGNFFSLKTTYRPDWFTISNYEGYTVVNELSIIPTWGIRRHIGKHFTYEAGIGAGYQYQFAKQAGFGKNNGEFALNLHLRIGYRF